LVQPLKTSFVRTDSKPFWSSLSGVLFTILASSATVVAQDIICPSIDCGNLNVNFNNSGQVVFCEGSTITLSNESTVGFDFFIIDWGDGAVDTLLNYDDAQHKYDIPDSLVCQTPQQSFSVTFRGIAICAEGNSCQEGAFGFGIRPEPFASFGVGDDVCISSPFMPSDQSCHAEEYLWDFGDGTTSTEPNPSHQYAAPGMYKVTQTVSNGCGSDMTMRTVTVVGEPEAAFTQSADGGCANTVIDFSDQSNEFSNTVWTILPTGDENWVFTDTLMSLGSSDISVRFRRPQSYTVRLTASNVCGDDIEETELLFEEAPRVQITAPPPACDQVTLTAADLGFQVDGSFNEVLWEFENGTPSTASGEDFGSVTFNQNGTIRLTVEGSCGNLNETLEVVVVTTSAITMPAVTDYCTGSTPDTLLATPAGGTWSGTGVSADGVFNPAIGEGTYTLTYRLNNAPCNNEANLTVTVTASEQVTVQDRTFCLDSPADNLSASPAGGSWGGNGIVDPNTGLFDPVQSGEGTFQPVYTYVDPNGCEVMGSSLITVDPIPELTLPDTLQLCLTNSDIDLLSVSGISANPAGGSFSWSGPGVTDPMGTFNAESAGLSAGIHELSVVYQRNACELSLPLIIELTTLEPLVIDPEEPVCIGQGTEQLTANLSGIWSGPGIDAATGVIDLQAAGGGMHVYTLDYAPGTSCAQTESITLEVIDLGAVVTAGPPESACEGPASYTLNGASPADGRWTGPGIDAISGAIDLTQLEPGQTYTYEYCVESQQVVGCTACSTKTLTYNPKPEAGFTFAGNPCINENFMLNPVQTGLSYAWDFGDGSSSNNESPTHTYTSPGNKTLTQIITTTAGCADTTTQNLYITSPPTAAFDLLDTEGCAPFSLNVVDNSFGDDITRQWCINGDTLPGPDVPQYIFDSLAQTTNFPILLKVTNLCGTRMDSAAVTVRPYPLVNFGLSEDEGCSPHQPDLINITVGEPDTYFWQITPNSTSTDFEPELPLFTTPEDSVSTYTISLTAENACGTGSVSRTLTVYPPDVEAFIGLDSLGGCEPFTLRPQSFSTPGSILSWEVLGPNGQVSGASGNRPELLLPDPGVYSIILYASRCGTDTDTAQVEVLPAPEIMIDHVPQVCLGDSIVFLNQTTSIGNSRWDFGDGTASAAYSAVHQYDSVGVYTVTYTAESLVNNCPASVSRSVSVLGLPTSAISPDAISGCPPLTVNFNNTSSGIGNLDFVWDFGDGTNRSFETAPLHEFTRSGLFEVKLITRDEAGCFSDTATTVINVFTEPQSSFNLLKDNLCIGYDMLEVEDRSIDAVSWSWTVGDQTAVGPTPVFTPFEAGEYTLELSTSNSFGCEDVSSQTFTVLTSPQAMFSRDPDSICANGVVRFSNQSQSADSYLWNLGDGTGSTVANLSHRYSTAGTYRIHLIARSQNACPADTAALELTVHPNPIAAFSIDQTFECGAPAEVLFTNQSSGHLSNEWSFGDGTTATNANPVHIYDFSGAYQARLEVVSEFGCRDTFQQMIDIYGDPVAVAGISSQRVCAGDPVTLRAEPTQALYYEWYLDNSLQADTGRVITYQPERPGIYAVRLIAIYNDLCRDTLDITNAFEVFRQPNADFEYIANESENVLGDVHFINLSTNATAYSWDLGDGTVTSQFEPVHEYDINRDILVRLVASNGNDGQFVCRDTVEKLVQPEWIVSFEVPNAFSPDYGEPAVRVFGAVGSGVLSYSLRVYSPYGALIWSTNELNEDQPSGRWSGEYPDGKQVPQGAYTWEAQVEFVSGQRIHKEGTVTVLR
jgi:PKD repeat protein